MKLSNWVLFDTQLKIQSEPMSLEKVQETILKINPDQLNSFFVWTQGWQNWQNLLTYLNSDQKNLTLNINKKVEEVKNEISKEPVLEDTTTNTVFFGDQYTQPGIALDIHNSSKPSFDFSKLKSTKMKKRAARYDLQLEVLLLSKKGIEFRSKSVNISVSGVLLDEDIPLIFYKEAFDLVVLNKLTKDPIRSRVKINSKPLKKISKNFRRQLQFSNATQEQIILLKSLLDEYLGAERFDKAIYTKVS